MRIVIHGQQAFGEAVLKKSLQQGENIVAVCTAPDQEGRAEDPLKKLALAEGIPVHQPKSWKTTESLDLMRSFDADFKSLKRSFDALSLPVNSIFSKNL